MTILNELRKKFISVVHITNIFPHSTRTLQPNITREKGEREREKKKREKNEGKNAEKIRGAKM